MSFWGLLSFWEGLFSGDVLVLGRVLRHLAAKSYSAVGAASSSRTNRGRSVPSACLKGKHPTVIDWRFHLGFRVPDSIPTATFIILHVIKRVVENVWSFVSPYPAGLGEEIWEKKKLRAQRAFPSDNWHPVTATRFYCGKTAAWAFHEWISKHPRPKCSILAEHWIMLTIFFSMRNWPA